MIMQRVLSATLVGAVLVSGAPTMAQSLSSTVATAQSRAILASAERLAAEVGLEQEATFVQRRRSGALAAIGGVLAATGAVLLLRPPTCALEGDAESETYDPYFNDTLRSTYSTVQIGGRCDLRVLTEYIPHDYPDFGYQFAEYQSDQSLYDFPWDFEGRTAKTNKTVNHVGVAAIGAGGVLLWFGLRQVEVPFRVDLGMGGRLSVSRSFGW